MGMIVYHFFWDLAFFRLVSIDVMGDFWWIGFARIVAGTFMIVVGISLVLAHQNGLKWPAFLRRLMIVATAAGAVTIATYNAFPDSFVYFGILHSIALASVLALPFLVAPILVVMASAVVILVLPTLFRWQAFDERILAWIGFAAAPPSSVDFVPIFPWFGLTLIGVVGTRYVLGTPLGERLAEIKAPGSLMLLAWAGRRSLTIYLLHQPILLGMLYFGILIASR